MMKTCFPVKPSGGLQTLAILPILLPHGIFALVLLGHPVRDPYVEFISYTFPFAVMLLTSFLVLGMRVKIDNRFLYSRGMIFDIKIAKSYIREVNGFNGINIEFKDGSDLQLTVRDSTFFNTNKYLIENVSIAEEISIWIKEDAYELLEAKEISYFLRRDFLFLIIISAIWSFIVLSAYFLIHPIVLNFVNLNV